MGIPLADDPIDATEGRPAPPGLAGHGRSRRRLREGLRPRPPPVEPMPTGPAVASHHLAVLCSLGKELNRTGEAMAFEAALRSALGRLTDVLDLTTAAAIRDADTDTWSRVRPDGARNDDLLTTAMRSIDAHGRPPASPVGLTDGATLIPFEGGHELTLLVVVPQGRALSNEEDQVLAAAAALIGSSAETWRLRVETRKHCRQYVQRSTRAQEEERGRIARELHDVATHELLQVGRHLDDLVGSDDVPAASRAQLRDARHRLGAVIDHLRRFGRDLRPAVLSHLGLPAGLRWLVDEHHRRGGPAARVAVTGTARRLPAETELALFRIAEEALRNTARHGNVRAVAVTLAFGEDGVRIEVTDDGDGFEVPATLEGLAHDGRLGLLGMRERAELVGACLDILSAPGAGARVVVHLPTAEPCAEPADGAPRAVEAHPASSTSRPR